MGKTNIRRGERMNSDLQLYKAYCTGCGLCGSIKGISFSKDEKGYPVPNLSERELDFCRKYCLAGGRSSLEIIDASMWGKYKKMTYAWSADQGIRERASSGGVLTSICCFLLRNNYVDGIIQTVADENIPYATETIISRCENDVLRCMGSRYSVSSPLLNIKQIIQPNEKYAFVGKPCDVSAIKLYMQDHRELKNNIVYLLSFFCAGIPSLDAQFHLLQELGCQNQDDCLKIEYRGGGWPGYTKVIKKDGSKTQMLYEDSWGRILGRNVRKVCRFCLDGIGESADIVCADAWYLDDKGTPIFSEGNGRNVVLCRTEEGQELYNKAICDGIIEQEEVNDDLYLKCAQPYQFERRATMGAMLSANKLCGNSIPQYNWWVLCNYSKHISIKKRIRRFFGILKRNIQRKL